jgi:hypothetical protein
LARLAFRVDMSVAQVVARDNPEHQDILAGVEPLFTRLVLMSLSRAERVLDAFAFHADYLDLTNPFRPYPRIRAALACLTGRRLIGVYAAVGGLAAAPSAAWVLRHAEDMELHTVALASVEAVCTRRTVRQVGIAHDVVLALRDGDQYRIGPHTDATRAEIIADRIRLRVRVAGPESRAPSRP